MDHHALVRWPNDVFVDDIHPLFRRLLVGEFQRMDHDLLFHPVMKWNKYRFFFSILDTIDLCIYTCMVHSTVPVWQYLLERPLVPCMKRVSVESVAPRRHRHRCRRWLQSMSYSLHIDSFYLCHRHRVRCQSSRFQADQRLCRWRFGPILFSCFGSLGSGPRYLRKYNNKIHIICVWID